jgi:hypothetical protein
MIGFTPRISAENIPGARLALILLLIALATHAAAEGMSRSLLNAGERRLG